MKKIVLVLLLSIFSLNISAQKTDMYFFRKGASVRFNLMSGEIIKSSIKDLGTPVFVNISFVENGIFLSVGKGFSNEVIQESLFINPKESNYIEKDGGFEIVFVIENGGIYRLYCEASLKSEVVTLYKCLANDVSRVESAVTVNSDEELIAASISDFERNPDSPFKSLYCNMKSLKEKLMKYKWGNR